MQERLWLNEYARAASAVAEWQRLDGISAFKGVWPVSVHNWKYLSQKYNTLDWDVGNYLQCFWNNAFAVLCRNGYGGATAGIEITVRWIDFPNAWAKIGSAEYDRRSKLTVSFFVSCRSKKQLSGATFGKRQKNTQNLAISGVFMEGQIKKDTGNYRYSTVPFRSPRSLTPGQR